MAIEIKMPNLSQTTEEVRLIRWIVAEGDSVKKGDPLCEVETDKVTMEVESFASGIVLKLFAEPDAIVDAGTVIAILGEAGEEVSAPEGAPSEVKEKAKDIKAPSRIKEAALASTVKTEDGIVATPMVRNMAFKMKVDLALVKGTGSGGLVTKKDLQKYIRSSKRSSVSHKTKGDDRRGDAIKMSHKELVNRLGKEKLSEMLMIMLEIREFEERIRFLFLEGKMPGTIHQYIGMEACAVGVCSVLEKDDVIASTHRPHGHAIARGITMDAMMGELYGKITGCCRGKGGSMHMGDLDKGMLPAIAIVGGNIPVVTGMALAFKLRNERRVAVSFFGDGASNEGAFHEGLNMAAVCRVPAVFVCENNYYAASTHISRVLNIENIADRASSYGMHGDIADGMDVLDVYKHAKEAVDRARSGEGPTLLELKTFRLCGHSRRDPNNYMSDEEKKAWGQRDPIPYFENILKANGILTEEEIEGMKKAVEEDVQRAIEFGRESPQPDPEDITRGLYVSMEVPQ